MECTNTVEERAPSKTSASKTSVGTGSSHPVPFGHVSYTPALPGAMGPLLDFPMEWWYYGGWAHNKSMSKQFTILIQTIRSSQSHLDIVILYGIGSSSVPGNKDQHFSTKSSAGSGFSPSRIPGKNIGLVIPPPTSTSWSLETHTETPSTIQMSCMLTSGTLGLFGAKYTLCINDVTNAVSASFQLKDTFGMILEGASGAWGESSYEFAMPSLTIESGSITMDGVKTELDGGNLWLDRQTDRGTGHGPGSTLHSKSQMAAYVGCLSDDSDKELYTGNWLAIVMNDHTVYNLVFFWPKEKQQWIVGSELHPPVNPIAKIGLEYPPFPQSNSVVQGVNVLDSSDFDLNILDPQHPERSPHWLSPPDPTSGKKTGNTYCTAWKLQIRKHVYTVTAFVNGSEVKLGGGFFEGAATISDGDGQVGYCFVEQMGYN